MSEIIDLNGHRLSKMSPDELIVESIESIASQLDNINKTLKGLTLRLHTLEQHVLSPSENSSSP